MFFVDKDISTDIIDERTKRKVLAHDDEMMACHLYFKTGSIGRKHSHSNTQICYIIKGDTRVLTSGDSVYIPSDAEHGLVCLEEGEVLDVFSPERKDFL